MVAGQYFIDEIKNLTKYYITCFSSPNLHWWMSFGKKKNCTFIVKFDILVWHFMVADDETNGNIIKNCQMLGQKNLPKISLEYFFPLFKDNLFIFDINQFVF